MFKALQHRESRGSDRCRRALEGLGAAAAVAAGGSTRGSTNAGSERDPDRETQTLMNLEAPPGFELCEMVLCSLQPTLEQPRISTLLGHPRAGVVPNRAETGRRGPGELRRHYGVLDPSGRARSPRTSPGVGAGPSPSAEPLGSPRASLLKAPGAAAFKRLVRFAEGRFEEGGRTVAQARPTLSAITEPWLPPARQRPLKK